MKIYSINKKTQNPAVVASKIDWNALQHVAIIGTTTDGNVLISTSYITPEQLCHLSMQLSAFVTKALNDRQLEL